MQYTVSTIFRGVDMMTGTMKKMAASSHTFAGSIEKNFRDVGVRLERMNSAIRGTVASGLAWGAAVAIPVASILKTGAEFEDTLIRAFAKLDERVAFGTDRFKELRTEIIAVSKGTEFTGQQAAEAFRELAGAGYDAARAVSALPTVFKLSRAAEMDLNETAVRSVDLLKAFNLESQDAEKNTAALAKASNMLAAADALSTTNMTQLFHAIQNSAPAVVRAGGDLETLLAIVANLGDIKDFEAGTGVKQLYSRLVPTEKNKRDLMNFLGITMKAKGGGIKDMVTVLEEMSVTLKRLTPYQRMDVLKRLFGEEGIAPAKIAEVFDKMPGKVRATREEIRSMSDQLERLDKEIQQGVKWQFGKALADLDRTKNALFEVLRPAATTALGRLNMWLSSKETQDKLANALIKFADNIPVMVDGLIYFLEHFREIAATLIALRLAELVAKLISGIAGLTQVIKYATTVWAGFKAAGGVGATFGGGAAGFGGGAMLGGGAAAASATAATSWKAVLSRFATNAGNMLGIGVAADLTNRHMTAYGDIWETNRKRMEMYRLQRLGFSKEYAERAVLNPAQPQVVSPSQPSSQQSTFRFYTDNPSIKAEPMPNAWEPGGLRLIQSGAF